MDEILLAKSILDEIGLSIAPGNILISQESMIPIMIDGKNIKYSFNDPSSVYTSSSDILFDPINNYKLMEDLLGFYVQNEFGDNAVSIITGVSKDEPKKTSRGVKFKNNTVVESGFYYNRCLSICDLILKFANMPSDLTIFDTDIRG